MNTIQKTNTSGFFSASTLKIIACICMTVDHIGAYLIPSNIWLRIIGRLAFPIFAYFIAEGCSYTRNKTKRLVIIALMAILCEAVYIAYTRKLHGNILITFTLSIVLIYFVDWLKSVFSKPGIFKKSLASLLSCIVLFGVYKLSHFLSVDYGFFGVLVPVFASLFSAKENKDARFLAFCFGLTLLILNRGITNIQVWSLFSLPFLAMYNGEPGVRRFKYGFYAFYPLHLIVIWLIGMIIN